MLDEPLWYKFGPFTFRRRGLALLKGETRIHLRPQAAELLLFLLDRRVAPVFRTEIENHLWKGGPPPEIDAGQQINSCIRLIRQALNDHAKAPTYISTCEGGSHFIAPVSAIGGNKFGTADDKPDD